MAENRTKHLTVQSGTLILINDKPFKVVLDSGNEGVVEDEMKALEAAGLTNGLASDEKSVVTCMNIPVINTNMA